MNATWDSNATQVRQAFDAAVPHGLWLVATAYREHLKIGLTASFTEPSRFGRIADSIRVSNVSGTNAGRFQIKVRSAHPLARFWELGWRHWRQGVVGRVRSPKGKVRKARLYKHDVTRHRRQVWRPILYDNLRHYRRLFRDHMEAVLRRPLVFRGR